MDTVKTQKDVEESVIRIIVDLVNVPREQVTRETTFLTGLPIDSIGMIEMMMAFEETFEISIPDEDAEKIHKVGEAIDYIAERLGYRVEK